MPHIYEPVGVFTPDEIIGIVNEARLCVVMLEQPVTPKQALELGAIVLLEKPFVVLRVGNATVPGLVADMAVEIIDLDEEPSTNDKKLNQRVKQIADRLFDQGLKGDRG